MNGLKRNFFQKIDPYEIGAIPTETPQDLTLGRFWHAGLESDVENIQIRHPDLEMKENDL